ncbi:MAG TPA: hypothetical protein VGO80_17660 [Solirubrobacteraceae bacterium]|nr:hypothetical protein [Solirubrobacteraceae bacterium]
MIRGSLTLVVGTLAAVAVLVTPIVLWARFGDAALLRTVAVATGSLLLCWVTVHAVTRRYAARRLPDRPRPGPRQAVVPAPAPCRSDDGHRTAAQRHRRAPALRPCGPSRCRPQHTSRAPRDIRCHAVDRPLGRRSARRRTRP